MTTILKKVSLALILSLFVANAMATEKVLFNKAWKFVQSDVANGQHPQTNDADWRILNLPHDWSIEGEYHETANGTDWQTGFLPAGIGWYRKSFDYNAAWDGKKVQIMFDGVYANSTVWINGKELGHRPNGYVSFYYDLTPHLQKGKNTIAVKVDTEKPLTARWYAGSGIYRNVWLMTSEKSHIEPFGIFFTTPEVSKQLATFNVQVEYVQDASVPVTAVEVALMKDGKEVAKVTQTIAKESSKPVSLNGELANPALWSPETPEMYTLVARLMNGTQVVDTKEELVGFRNLEFTVDRGFLLNDERTVFKGVCDHHTASIVGAALPDDVLYRRLRILKDMGCNAIRTAHNPFSPQFYTMCDTIGFLVMNEAWDGWDKAKAKHDYGLYFTEWWRKDLTEFMKRDRNHPSIVIWSIGNEVPNNNPEMQKLQVDLSHELDPTRPVTQGGTDPTRGMVVDYEKNFQYLDIVGFNGNGEEVGEFEKFAKQNEKMKRLAIGTEVPHTYQTRGVYRTRTTWRRRDFPAPWELRNPIPWEEFQYRVFEIPHLSEEEFFPEETNMQNYQSSYDNASVRISARESWFRTNSFPFLMGEFRWGSFDYLGEAEWPQRTGNFGIIDLCGFPKDHYYLYQSLWSDKPMVHLLPHWTHPGKVGKICPVVVYTNCEEAELFLNGKSLGKQTYKNEQLVWNVPYRAGELKVLAYNDGKVAAEKIVRTAGKPQATAWKADKMRIRPNSTDVVHIELDVVDSKKDGNLCPMADNELTVSITGPAKLLGMDNGDPIDHTSYANPTRKAFRGKLLIMIQATDEAGIIDVSVTSPGLRESKIRIESIAEVPAGVNEITVNLEQEVKRNVKGAAGANLCWLLDSDKERPRPISMYQALDEMGSKFLRYPYGALADNYLWTTPPYRKATKGLTPRVATMKYPPATWDWCTNPDGTFIKDMDFDEYIAMTQKLDAEPLIMVNVLSHKMKGGPSLDYLVESAAEWVRYANKKRGYNVKYWQLGNEVEHKKVISMEEYVDAYGKIAAAMKAVDPTIKVGTGVLGKAPWNKAVLDAHPELVDFISCHQYAFFYYASNNGYDGWKNAEYVHISNVRDMQNLLDNTPNGENVEIHITETGSTGGTWPEGRTQDLYRSLYWFEVAMEQLSLKNVKANYFWCTHSPWGGEHVNEGLEYLLTNKENERTSMGQMSMLINKYMPEVLVATDRKSKYIRSYAGKSTDGNKITLLLLNKNNKAETVNVNVSSVIDFGKYTATKTVYTGTAPTDTKPIVKTVSTKYNGTKLTDTLAPYSLTVIEMVKK